jgi:putative MFS transporter
MGVGYGMGGLGKMLGPVALAIFAGSSNLVSPKATLEAIPAAFGLWAAAGVVIMICCYFGVETRNKSIEQIDSMVHIPSAGDNKIKA